MTGSEPNKNRRSRRSGRGRGGSKPAPFGAGAQPTDDQPTEDEPSRDAPDTESAAPGEGDDDEAPAASRSTRRRRRSPSSSTKADSAPAESAPARSGAPKSGNRPRRKSTPSEQGQTTSLVRVLNADGHIVDGAKVHLDGDTLSALYRQMVEVREFDRRMLVLQRQGRIGFYGPILGQEAATVGSVAAVRDTDWIFPALREGAAAMMRGLPMHLAIAQLIGNDADLCRGRQMPCHYTWKTGRYVSMSSVIGTQISHAAGAAIAARIRGDDTVVLGYMGDGATSANDFHAGMNFAGVMKAPVIMFCQNNHWAISVPVASQHASETIAIKARAYGMPGVRVDGNDVIAVHQVTQAAAERARAGEGPTFVEAVTYRRLGHSSSDEPDRYRDAAEVKAWEDRDPVARLRRYLINESLWSDEAETELQDRIARSVNDAIAAAEEGGELAPESLIEDVFESVPDNLREHFERAHPND